MPGPAPKLTRRRKNVPARGDWQATPGIGWQHGPIPEPPDGLVQPSRDAWAAWFAAWFASHWTPADLPGLRHLILLFNAVQTGERQRSAEVRMTMDTYGITPRGQSMLRWKEPDEAKEPPKAAAAKKKRYGHLQAVDG